MNLKELAKKLGLPETAEDKDVLAKAGEVVLEGLQAKEGLSTVEKQLEAHGLKLDGEKVVKLAEPPSGTPSDDDDPEKAELRKRVAALESSGAKERLSAAKAEAEKLVKAGVVPPAVKEELSSLLSEAGQAQALALSNDGQPVTQALNVAEKVRKVLNALPKITQQRLSQLGVSEPSKEESDKRQALSTKAKGIAARVERRKPEKQTA